MYELLIYFHLIGHKFKNKSFVAKQQARQKFIQIKKFQIDDIVALASCGKNGKCIAGPQQRLLQGVQRGTLRKRASLHT